MLFRRLAALSLLALAASCGHKETTQTTSTTSTAATAGPAAASGSVATPSGAMSSRGMNGTTTGGTVNAGAGQPAAFDTESAAQAHCQGDQVVWLNIKSHVYHLKGTTYYAHTKSGAYVCRKEADADGDRAAKNGS